MVLLSTYPYRNDNINNNNNINVHQLKVKNLEKEVTLSGQVIPKINSNVRVV